MSEEKLRDILKLFLTSISGNDIMQTNNDNYDCIDRFLKSEKFNDRISVMWNKIIDLMPIDRDFEVLFEDGSVRNYSDEHPFLLITAWRELQ